MSTKENLGRGKRHKGGGLRQKSVKIVCLGRNNQEYRCLGRNIQEYECLGRNNQEYKCLGRNNPGI